MERKRILIAINTPSDITRLKELLTTSGYEVKVVDNGATALKCSREFRPHLVLAELFLTKIDGHHLLREIRGDSSTRRICFIMMSRHRSVEERVHTISLGVDDYITVPFDIREVLTRIEILLKELEFITSSPQRNNRGFAGKLCDMNTIEIVQALEIGKKSGILWIASGDDEGIIYVRDGEIVDVEMAELPNLHALFRMFTWSDGNFRFEMGEIEQTSRFDESTADLIKKGLVYKDRWDNLCLKLPPLRTAVQKNQQNNRQPGSEDEQSVLGITNGNSRMVDLVRKSKFDDLKTLKILTKLLNQGVLKEIPPVEVTTRQNGSHNKNGNFTNSPGTRITRLVGSFLHSGAHVNKKKHPTSFGKSGFSNSSRNSNPPTITNQIHLNKSELLMIREKLLNRTSS